MKTININLENEKKAKKIEIPFTLKQDVIETVKVDLRSWIVLDGKREEIKSFTVAFDKDPVTLKRNVKHSGKAIVSIPVDTFTGTYNFSLFVVTMDNAGSAVEQDYAHDVIGSIVVKGKSELAKVEEAIEMNKEAQKIITDEENAVNKEINDLIKFLNNTKLKIKELKSSGSFNTVKTAKKMIELLSELKINLLPLKKEFGNIEKKLLRSPDNIATTAEYQYSELSHLKNIVESSLRSNNLDDTLTKCLDEINQLEILIIKKRDSVNSLKFNVYMNFNRLNLFENKIKNVMLNLTTPNKNNLNNYIEEAKAIFESVELVKDEILKIVTQFSEIESIEKVNNLTARLKKVGFIVVKMRWQVKQQTL